MAETVFAQILRGELPCHKVYEDDLVFAFLDIFPLCHGHTLVIPREPAATLDQLSDEASAAIGRVLPRVARAVMKVTGVAAYNVIQNNTRAAHQFVDHVHFHVIPKYEDGAGLGLEWESDKLEDEVGAKLARDLADAVAAES